MPKRIPFDPNIWRELGELFNRESDRGAALLFAAVLDNQLGHLLGI